jgi:hypothetical protein
VNSRDNLLHLVFEKNEYDFPEARRSSYLTDMRDKLQYLCDHLPPTFIHQKNNQGSTPLHHTLVGRYGFDMKTVICLCNADVTVVRDKCPALYYDIDSENGRLPLHLLISQSRPLELSVEGDCFRLFLRLYPAAASFEDGVCFSLYKTAVLQKVSTYFIRLLLAADPTIDPVKRKDLNFEARKEGMFLAYRALSPDSEPTIWAKIRYKDKNLLSRVISYL